MKSCYNTSLFRATPFLICLITAVVYIVSYLTYQHTPGNNPNYPEGWFGWCDQGAYLASAKAITDFKLSSATYIYPLGYPLLGSIFVKLFPRHLFFVPNMIFAVGIVYFYYASCRKFISNFESILLTCLLIIGSGFVTNHLTREGLLWFNSLIVPWNIIPVFFACYLTVWLLVFNEASWSKLWITSIFITIATMSRPPDLIFLGIIYLAGICDLKTIKKKMLGVGILALPVIATTLVTLLIKWKIFGSFVSDYDRAIAHQGFSFHNLLFKFYLNFFDGSQIHGYRELMLVPQMPWILLSIPGIFFLAKKTNNKSWFLMMAIFVCLVLYTSFNGVTPVALYFYHGYRYITWIFPLIGLCAYLTITRAPLMFGIKKTLAGACAGILFVTLIGCQEYRVASIIPNDKGNTNTFEQTYNYTERFIEARIYVQELKEVAGFKMIFKKPPSNNVSLSTTWQDFHLYIFGKDQGLSRNYSLYQLGNVVYIAFNNVDLPKDTKDNKQLTVRINNTEFAELKDIELTGKKFKLFGFLINLIDCLKHPVPENKCNDVD